MIPLAVTKSPALRVALVMQSIHGSATKSSALRVALVMQSIHGSSLSSGISSKQGLLFCVVSSFFVLVEVLVVVLSRVVIRFVVGVVESGGVVDASGMRSCMT